MSVISVAVADDDALFRDALVDVLEADARFAVVVQATSAEEIVAAVARTRPDLVLLDVRMPGGGAEAARAITQATESAGGSGSGPVLVALSAEAGAPRVLSMLRVGVTSFFEKGSVGAELTDQLVRSARGEVLLAARGAAEALRTLIDGGAEGA